MTPFSFGENWLKYSKIIDETRVNEAEQSLRRLLSRERLDGLSFLDVGSGSALFAIAAVRLGASLVAAFDRDSNSVAAGRMNIERFLNAASRDRIDVRAGDVLVPPTNPPQYDIVYAWGSLHHTGSMWTAIDNAWRFCSPQGEFVIAIYNRTWFSPAWLRIKQIYNRSPSPVRLMMAGGMTAVRAAVRALQFKPPLRVERGMTVWYDAVDWLGGLPYECATVEEVVAFMTARGAELIRKTVTSRSGCNEFVFRKQA
jgi:2-polyprenyl-6-hydroxyphenyl methylase/3-demethylubiquinone-9 3-methyltransferase